MNKLYETICESTGGKFDCVRFASVKISKSGAAITAYCPSERFEEIEKSKPELLAICEKELNLHSPITVDIIKQNPSPELLKRLAADFGRRFSYIGSAADRIRASDDAVIIPMHEAMYNLAKNDFIPRIKEYLANVYVRDVEVKVEHEALSVEQPKPVQKIKPEKYGVKNLAPVVGDDGSMAILLQTERAFAPSISGNYDNAAVCGTLAMATEYMSKGGGAKRSRPYEKFLIVDGDDILQCRFFPRGSDGVLNSRLVGETVCVLGNAQFERGRTGETSITVNAVCKCEIDGIELPKTKHALPAEYKTVVPKPYNEYVQASLFSKDSTVCASLRGEFVAFDFETTGLSIAFDKPTELGAVKIKDGVITETFHTLIDPQRPIPEVVVKKTGITDDMVKGQPLFENILPDFYLFTRGCGLIGHNIAFDFPFLLKYGARAGWDFSDLATFDTLGLAPRVLKGIDVLTLDNVLSLLGLVNDNAHRALSDATATAKAFIAMNQMAESEGN